MIRKEMFIIVALLLGALGVITWVKYDRGEPAADASLDKKGSMPTFWTFFDKATQQRIKGNTDSSIANYQEALKLNPDHEDALYYLGNMFMKAGQFDSAQFRWEELIGKNPQSERAYYQMGNLFFCVQHPDFFHPEKAKTYFLKARDLNRESMNPGIRLGEIALFQNDLDKSYDILSKISEQKNPVVFFVMGYLNWKKGNKDLAAVDLEKTLDLKGLKVAFDEGGKAVLTKKVPASTNEECSLYLYWLDHKLKLPPHYKLQNVLSGIFTSFELYLSQSRVQLNRK